ncbi:transposase [Streptomyces dangxiongensis]|uniref:Transposase n=1 Tax=Streptomyces dangxiongensis TaxID=1442032 RepID=A0A3G2J8J7_9ACTN|nr:transposase [Streptomyces dangxiongensis]
MLMLDDTQVIKKGDKSVGIGHQHCGTTGDVRNCQVMVMLTYAAASGHTFYDRRLYLPQSWTGDRERCRAAGVPDEVAFATKPKMGLAMLQGAVAGDLLHYATVREQWERRSQGEGAKGQRAYDWTWFEVTLPGQIPADGFAHQTVDPPKHREEATGRRPRRLRVRVLPRPCPGRRPGHRGDREGRGPLEDRGEQRTRQTDHRPRPVPGPPMDVLAPARHLRDARPGLPNRPARPPPRPRTRTRSPRAARRP